jgi:hypothetical protein
MRNGMVNYKRRFHADGQRDPVAQRLVEAFRGVGIAAWSEVGYSWKGHEGEIDVLASVDGVLFAFECKHNLLPCSAFELRTTWDYVETASTQLDRLRALWSDLGFREMISKKTGVDATECSIVSAIVFSHRLFAGIEVGGHSVRHCRELVRFVESGDSTFALGDLKKRIWLRPTGRLRAEDLRRYLSTETSHYSALWAAHVVDDVALQFSRCSLVVERYGFISARYFARVLHLPELLVTRVEGLVNELVALERDGNDGIATEKYRSTYMELMGLFRSHLASQPDTV